MRTTTLNKIKAHSPCGDGWENLLTFLGKTEADDEPLSYLTILESNGLADCLESLEESYPDIPLKVRTDWFDLAREICYAEAL